MKTLREATFMMYINNRRFEWDEEKDALNFIKHRIAFKDALPAFDDPLALIEEDTGHSQHERRQKLVGLCLKGIVVTVYTMRPERTTRIINARPASRKERRRYEQER